MRSEFLGSRPIERARNAGRSNGPKGPLVNVQSDREFKHSRRVSGETAQPLSQLEGPSTALDEALYSLGNPGW